MPGSFFGDARSELEFDANHWLRKLGSLISSVGTSSLLFWGNKYYLDSLTDENDCDFQLFIITFLNAYVRSSSYFPRKNGLVTDKTEAVLLDAFARYYSSVRKLREIEQSLDDSSVHIPAVIHSDDIASMADFFRSELSPFASLMEGSVGCGPDAVVDAFSALASNSLNRKVPLKLSSLMIRPEMNIPRLFLEMTSSRLSEGPALNDSSFCWAEQLFPIRPVLKLDGSWFCFAPQVAFPQLLKMVKSAVSEADDDGAAAWREVEHYQEMTKMAKRDDAYYGNPYDEEPDYPEPEEPDEEPDYPEPEEPDEEPEEPDDDELAQESIFSDDDEPEDSDDDEPGVGSKLNDGLDEDPYDYSQEESEEFDDYSHDGKDDEPEQEDIYSILDEEQEKAEEKEEAEEEEAVPESVQPSLFGDIVVSDGKETIVSSPVEADKPDSASKIDVLKEAVMDEIENEKPQEASEVLPMAPIKLGQKQAGAGAAILERAEVEAGSSPVVSTYLSALSAEEKADLQKKIDDAVAANIADGKDKMFSISEQALSFCVVSAAQDSFARMEMENSIAAVMLVNEKTAWNAFVIKPLGEEQGFGLKLVPIRKAEFQPRRWRLVQQLGWKLYMQMKKGGNE
ncbi:MAG: hypothetical protein PHS20_05505 [Sphaerochaetaceae bacterium]|nr:hypothetical protein [Sphaerochaetaceae bacterium]